VVHRTPFFLPALYPSLTWRIDTPLKELYLTFDDGPIPGPTEFVLDTLARYNARATFFCIGDNVRKHPAVYRQVVAGNHAIGNHTFNHLNGWKTPREGYVQNIQECQSVLMTEGKSTVASEGRLLFRPPYGRITRSQIRSLSALYHIVMWDVLSVDYNKNLSAEACLRNTIGACRPGSIVVFHDSVKAEKNMMYALPRVLDHFSAAGYVFKPLPA